MVDDGPVPTKCTLGQKYFRAPRIWEPGLNTQRFSMEFALNKVEGEYIYVIEDDDFYAPTYIEAYLSILKHVHIVGEAYARYYHVQIPGHKQLSNHTHSALSQTAFRKSVLPLMRKAVNSGEFYFDTILWGEAKLQGTPKALLSNSGLSFGMKGLPGRAGLTPSHQTQRDYMLDAGRATIIKWIGKDSDWYLPFAKKHVSIR